MKRAEKRDYLVDIATRLFNQMGYHAVGIDMVIAEAGIAKTTLYRHFKSKDELIVAVLQRLDKKYRDDMQNRVIQMQNKPVKQLLATFDFLEEWFNHGSFFGCPFISAAAEYGEADSPVFQQTVLHKKLMISYFEKLARSADLEKPAQVAEEINILHEGATAVAHIMRDAGSARIAKSVAARIIKEAMK